VTSCRRAALTLIVIAPVLTEIVSGNMPAHALLNPRLAGFLFLAYSFPLVVIREVALRWRLPVTGVFLLGLAYGILNEGLLAQTLIRSEHVPIDRFDHYLFVRGFNFSWTCVIVPWHGFLAVLFPIALVSRWFPTCAQMNWLSRPAFVALTSLLIGLVVFVGLARTPHPQMVACLVAMAALVWLASVVRDQEPRTARQGLLPGLAFLLGSVSYLVFVLGLIVLAARRVSPLAYFSAVATMSLSFTALNRSRGLLLSPTSADIALGAYFVVALFNLMGGIAHRSMESVVTGGLLAAAFLVLEFARRDTGSKAGLT
jgi:hypothetical protein